MLRSSLTLTLPVVFELALISSQLIETPVEVTHVLLERADKATATAKQKKKNKDNSKKAKDDGRTPAWVIVAVVGGLIFVAICIGLAVMQSRRRNTNRTIHV